MPLPSKFHCAFVTFGAIVVDDVFPVTTEYEMLNIQDIDSKISELPAGFRDKTTPKTVGAVIITDIMIRIPMRTNKPLFNPIDDFLNKKNSE